MLSNDIDIVDKAFVDICHPEAVVDSWYRIKTAITVLQKKATYSQGNSLARSVAVTTTRSIQIKPCTVKHNIIQLVNPHYKYCPECGVKL